MNPIKILIADDHWLIRTSLKLLIGRAPGMQLVGEAENGQVAVEMTKQLRPDVVLMDVRMPVLGGVAATKTIKARFPQVAVIALSNSSDENDIYVMKMAGAAEYLIKSIGPKELEAAIKNSVTRKGNTAGLKNDTLLQINQTDAP